MTAIKLICVRCGKDASEGSMKHPYCAKCFKEVWNNDYREYFRWLDNFHNVWKGQELK